jgi:hypothetical protein
MEPGETVVSAINFRDHILIFGSYGTVLKGVFDAVGDEVTFQVCMKLPMHR